MEHDQIVEASREACQDWEPEWGEDGLSLTGTSRAEGNRAILMLQPERYGGPVAFVYDGSLERAADVSPGDAALLAREGPRNAMKHFKAEFNAMQRVAATLDEGGSL